MKIATLNDLFVAELSDMLDAETQLTKALPKMAENCKDRKLADGFQMHFEETRGQIDRIMRVAKICGFTLARETCEAMQGLIKEGEQMMKDIKDKNVLDAALITAAQKVEHYEISSYGSLIALGKCLEIEDEALDLLEENLEEEKNTDKKLSKLAEDEGINEQALREAA